MDWRIAYERSIEKSIKLEELISLLFFFISFLFLIFVMKEEELREQIKNKIKIIDKEGNEWYDTMMLLVFIEKYYTALTDNKVLVIKSEWQHFTEAALVVATLGPDDDCVDWDEDVLVYITFKDFQEIEHRSGWEWTAVDEIIIESHLDILLSSQDLDHDNLFNFLAEYIPLSQRLYIYKDYDEDRYGDSKEKIIHSTDFDLLQLIIGENYRGSFEIELIL